MSDDSPPRKTPGLRWTDPELLTSADVEQLAQLKPSTLRALRSRRQIPYVRLGGGRIIRYRRRAIEKWIAAREVDIDIEAAE